MTKPRTLRCAQRKLEFDAETKIVVADDDDDDDNDKMNNETLRKRPAQTQSASPIHGYRKRLKSEQDSPAKDTKATAVVTPPQPAKTSDKTKEYVPSYIHKNLDYQRKGLATHVLPPNIIKAFQLIEKYYHIPADIEQSRLYGPLSGISYEEKVIAALRLGKLRSIDTPATEICTVCAELGHQRDDCPALL